jgi:hypothetical protein
MLGERLGDGDTDGLNEGERLGDKLGDSDGDLDADGETPAESGICMSTGKKSPFTELAYPKTTLLNVLVLEAEPGDTAAAPTVNTVPSVSFRST